MAFDWKRDWKWQDFVCFMQAGISGGGSLPSHVDRFFEVRYSYMLLKWIFQLPHPYLSVVDIGNWCQIAEWIWINRVFPCRCCSKTILQCKNFDHFKLEKCRISRIFYSHLYKEKCMWDYRILYISEIVLFASTMFHLWLWSRQCSRGSCIISYMYPYNEGCDPHAIRPIIDNAMDWSNF